MINIICAFMVVTQDKVSAPQDMPQFLRENCETKRDLRINAENAQANWVSGSEVLRSNRVSIVFLQIVFAT